MFTRSVLSSISFATVLLGMFALREPGALSAADVFLRGDANSDGGVSISDSITIRRFLFTGGVVPSCMDTADVDDDGRVNITDQVKILQQFIPAGPGGPGDIWGEVIAAPFPEPGADPTADDLGCESYDVEPPEQTDDLVRLGDVTAAPGQAVEIPVFVTSSVNLDAVQIIVDYDPAVFTPGAELNYDGTFFEGPFREPPRPLSPALFSALKVWPDLDGLTIAIVGDLLGVDVSKQIPAGEEILIAKIPGTISPDVQPGTLSLEVRTEPFGTYGIRTELTHTGQARLVSTLPKVQGAILQIVGDLTFFRGDANNDESVDVSDAQFTLNYLFLGGSDAPSCFDAADANDDGRVDIADAITTLMFLFGGSDSLAPPHPAKGFDLTDDPLSCAGVSA